MDQRRGDPDGRCMDAPVSSRGRRNRCLDNGRILGAMGRLRLALVLAGALALLPVPAAVAAAPGRGSATADPQDAARPYSMVLGRRADFVAQANFVQCV